MKVKTSVVIIFCILSLLGNSIVTVSSTVDNTPALVQADTVHQQIVLTEIVRDNGTEMKVTTGSVLDIDEEGGIYGPIDQDIPLEISKDIEIKADSVTLSDIVINGDLYVYADNIVLSNLVIKGTLFISSGKALKLDKVSSENVEIIDDFSQYEDSDLGEQEIPDEGSDESGALQQQYEPKEPEALPQQDDAHVEYMKNAPVIPYKMDEPHKQDTPIIIDWLEEAQPQEMPKHTGAREATKSAKEPKAVTAYLRIASIDDPSSYVVVVNKGRNLPPLWKPDDLVRLQVPYKGRAEARYLRNEAADELTKMFAKAKGEGVELYAVSGFRSYDLQKTVFTKYTNMLGAILAQRVSAMPGQSEHQTGLAIDISSKRLNYNLSESFGATIEGKWLALNAAEFGFVLRYPKGKESITGYSYEPWHFRYVGKDIAVDVTDKGITLEEYFGMVQPKQNDILQAQSKTVQTR